MLDKEELRQALERAVGHSLPEEMIHEIWTTVAALLSGLPPGAHMLMHIDPGGVIEVALGIPDPRLN